MSKRWFVHCLNKTHALQRVRDKPYKDSGAHRISKTFKNSVVQGMLEWPLQIKGQSIASHTSHHEEKVQHLIDLFRFWRQHMPYLEILLWSTFQVILKAASPEWGPEQKRGLQQVQSEMQAVLSLRLYDLADSMILEVSIVGKYVVWSLWEAQVGDPWGSWARLWHLQQRICTPFEKKISVQYWALIETECLIMEYQVTMHLEVPIIS